ncbi:hypothetical protein [Bifidobacterium dentium]|uniref:hypothetical protein n=1 Tax=Bifidobacterium dentium TaxID=1689 RepID=UPI002FD836D6
MIFDDGKPIGMARLLGDYAMAYLIKDVAGLLEYQHRGAGTLLKLRGSALQRATDTVGRTVRVEAHCRVACSYAHFTVPYSFAFSQ